MSESITEERLAEIEREIRRDTCGEDDAHCCGCAQGLNEAFDLLAEVRRLRAEIQEMAVLVGRLRGESDTLRADLAEEKQEHQATLAMNAALRERVRVLEGVLEALRDEECACMGWGGGSDCCAVRSQDEAAKTLDGEA